ncbi:isochorismate synthase [Arthrobacter sp. A5]|uniref:isochorismate synthase n=1 Tax=Arthrobacter sp. A5 TaxID=576926 RepID=UPI003DA84C86
MIAPLTTLTVPLDTSALDTSFFDPSPATADSAPGQDGAARPGALLNFLRADAALCWVRRCEGLVGFGEIARFTGTGPERFSAAESWWKELLAGAAVDDGVRLPGTGPIAFGTFAFSKTSDYKSRLIVPRIVVGFRGGRAWLTELCLDGGSLTAEGAHAELARLAAAPGADDAAGGAPGGDAAGAARTGTRKDIPAQPRAELAPGSLTEQEWMDSVAAGVRAIESEHLEKIVLARDIVARLDGPVSRAGLLQTLAQQYSECWTYGVEGVVGSTPEMLIKVEGTTALARVLAGTLDREGAPEDGEGFAREVLAGSVKQRQEHDFAVHSLTRQLAPFAVDLSVPPEPFILELPNVWHLASDVEAVLADADGHLPTSLALVEALHPTAAVCGTPRSKAGALILELEQLDRGPYAGPVGWLDGAGNGEWGIALRGAVLEDPTTVRLYAGAGIVAASDPAAELAETWAKFRPMLQALGLRT